MVDELIDRFGEPPVSVLGLIDIAELRNLAAARGIYEMKQADGRVLLYQKKIDKQEIARLIAKMNGRVLVSAGSKPYISIKMCIRDRPEPVILPPVSTARWPSSTNAASAPMCQR